MDNSLTAKEKILEVIESLGGEASLAQIVVAAWKLDPVAFGLGDHNEYPCSIRVYSCFCGRNGLVTKGEVVSVGPKRYRLTKRTKPRPPPDSRLKALLASEAVRKWQLGVAAIITQADAELLLCDHSEWLITQIATDCERQLLQDVRNYLKVRYGIRS